MSIKGIPPHKDVTAGNGQIFPLEPQAFQNMKGFISLNTQSTGSTIFLLQLHYIYTIICGINYTIDCFPAF